MAISRMSASLATAHNENTLALANLNFDISLLRVEVPAEYSGLGAALTNKRRASAEEGSAHRTARRLGILFQDILPSTPELLRAYGRRASEISQRTARKGPPEGRGTGDSKSPHHQADNHNSSRGIFAGFAGADVTSVWAAATSGPASIAIHLLACLLARLWSGPEATSIWVEIVSERKQIVQRQMEQGVYNVSFELHTVCQQEISRADLGQWDASARAWLQIADEAQMLRQKQLMLILNNIHLPVNMAGSTFDRVIDAWLTAMNTMEKLVNGQPQRAAKGAAFMGLSAWHLYPDLLVLEGTISAVKFHDEAILGSAQLTVGLENVQPGDHDGIYWSLSLSHIRYYGDPVLTTTYTSRDASRLSIDELHLLALGSTLARWGNMGLDPYTGARFFFSLCSAIGNPQESLGLTWLDVLYKASNRFLQASEEERKYLVSIIALGRRRGSKFLGETYNHPPPLLGLNHPFIMSIVDGTLGLAVNHEVERLLFIASKFGMEPEDLIIRFPQASDSAKRHYLSSGRKLFEYRTVMPHESCVRDMITAESHIRWVETYDYDEHDDTPIARVKFEPCRCHDIGHSCHDARCSCMQRNVPCTPNCHRFVDTHNHRCELCNIGPHNLPTPTTTRIPKGLGCGNLPEGDVSYRVLSQLFIEMQYEEALGVPDWKIGTTRPTSKFKTAPKLALRHNTHAGPLCPCYQTSRQTPTVFTLLAGNPEGVALFAKVDAKVQSRRRNIHKRLDELAAEPLAGPQEIIEALESGRFNPERLAEYLSSFSFSATGKILIPTFNKDLNPQVYAVRLFVDSLNALGLASDVYNNLSGATISPGITERPLHTLHWVPKSDRFWKRKDRHLDRAQKFACIAYLESGIYNIPPSDLKEIIALSTRNTIYVSEALLKDPFKTQHRNGIARIIGNVGKTGMAMMVAPVASRIRPCDISSWRQISHNTFQGDREDCFGATSLHLSFTGFEMPFDVGRRGAIDTDIVVVEAVISVHDRGKWVGDIDVLRLYEPSLPMNHRLKRYYEDCLPPVCFHTKDFQSVPQRLTQIDNWEELLDIPDDLGKEHIGVVRAKDNWLARLAAACIAVQTNLRTVIIPSDDNICWACCCKQQWGWTMGTEADSTGQMAGRLDQEAGTRSQLSEIVMPQHSPFRVEVDLSPKNPFQPKDSSQAKDPVGVLPKDPFEVLHETDSDSDDSVCTVGISREADDGYSSLPHLFIY